MGGDWNDLGIRGELHRRHLPFVREPRGNHGGKGFNGVVLPNLTIFIGSSRHEKRSALLGIRQMGPRGTENGLRTQTTAR